MWILNLPLKLTFPLSLIKGHLLLTWASPLLWGCPHHGCHNDSLILLLSRLRSLPLSGARTPGPAPLVIAHRCLFGETATAAQLVWLPCLVLGGTLFCLLLHHSPYQLLSETRAVPTNRLLVPAPLSLPFYPMDCSNWERRSESLSLFKIYCNFLCSCPVPFVLLFLFLQLLKDSRTVGKPTYY